MKNLGLRLLATSQATTQPKPSLCLSRAVQKSPSQLLPSVFCPLSSALCPLPSVLCPLSSVLWNWWSQSGSNRRPPACKAGALPAELWPRQKTDDPPQKSIKKPSTDPCHPPDPLQLVGLGGLEPPTSPLSGVRSNHLSYRPGRCLGVRPAPPSPAPLAFRISGLQVSCVSARQVLPVSKGGDPAAPSDTATLLRLHPSHRPHRGKRPPEG